MTPSTRPGDGERAARRGGAAARLRVALAGFMAAGKTTVGALAAERLGLPFVDLDRAIERRAGAAVEKIFDVRGERGFRQLESEELALALDRDRVLVALGGGALTVAANRNLLSRRAETVWLDAPLELLLERLEVGAGRPLYADREQAARLFRDRLPGYRACRHRLRVAPEETAEEVASRLVRVLGEAP